MRILRVIARMNIGGPAYHVALLSARLDRDRYRTLLAHGKIGPGEGSFEHLATQQGCEVRLIPHLGPEVRPFADLRALVDLIRLVRRFRPHIVHTHTAKAGALGRLAAVLAGGRRAAILHTYHGHVLEGYFGRPTSLFYRWTERAPARVSDCLIGVSRATVDDLVRLGVASREAFRVVPIGLELERFARPTSERTAWFRGQVGAASDGVLLAYVGRLVPIKRIDVLLEALARAHTCGAKLRLAIVGDGQCRSELETLAARLGLASHVTFTGYMPDITAVAAGSDIAVLSSDNEGTPVSLIEAGAAGKPSVACAVGGVPDVVEHGASGLLVPPRDSQAFADALLRLAADPVLRERMGRTASEHVRQRFSSETLLASVDALYRELLAQKEGRLAP